METTKTQPNDPIDATVETCSYPHGEIRMECTNSGLTKREYFAAMAMQGMLSNSRYTFSTIKQRNEIAGAAVEQADELIKALNENGNN